MIEDQGQGIGLLKDPKTIEIMSERGTGITRTETEINLAQKGAKAAFFALYVEML